jgi:hypothetical protein
MGWLRAFTDGEATIFAAAAARDRAVLFSGGGDDAAFFLEPVPAPFFVLAVTLALAFLFLFGDDLAFTGLGDLHARGWVSTPIWKVVGRMVLVGRVVGSGDVVVWYADLGTDPAPWWLVSHTLVCGGRMEKKISYNVQSTEFD